jgi:hypothetical protein
VADIADKAGDHIERESVGLLAQRKPAGPTACGACHYCGEDVRGEARWCDSDCRDDWEKDQRAAKNRAVE